jgi:hypothetical protein
MTGMPIMKSSSTVLELSVQMHGLSRGSLTEKKAVD